jgi:serine/threonine protein kinase
MNDSGLVIHAYRVMERIGNGCFATVLKARHRSNGRVVALKIEPKHTSIRHESRVLSFLRRELSPDTQYCVPTVYWYGTYGGNICLAMTFYERAIGRPDDIMVTLDVCRQIMAAFRWIHETGILHCDVKPDNMMMDERGRVVVIDFGLASMYKDVDSGEHNPNVPSSHLVGSPKYASYFVHQGNSVSRRDDLISVGYLMMWLFGVEMEWSGATVKNEVTVKNELSICHIQHPANIERAKCKKPERLVAYLENAGNTYLVYYFKCVYNLEHGDDPNYSDYLRELNGVYAFV